MPETTTSIELPCGAVALIDTADNLLACGFGWRKIGNGYVQASRGDFTIYLHRLIAGAGPKDYVDHINGDPLDNRSANLRLCNASQNHANRGADRRRLGSTSRHKGVSWDKRRSKWVAHVHVDGRTRYLGRYASEDEAALAYNAAAVEAWGEFARLNIVEATS
jgi:hypothetical protein